MEKVKEFWLRLPLNFKITGLTSLLVLIAVLSLTLLSIRRERLNFKEGLETQAEIILKTIPRTFNDHVYPMEVDELIETTRIGGDNVNITMLVIFDKQGKILADSRESTPIFKQEVDQLGSILLQWEGENFYTDWQEDQLIAGRPIVLGNQPIGALAVGLSTNSLNSNISTLTQQNIILAVLIISIGIGLSILYMRQIIYPLIELTEVTTQMSTGDLTLRAEIQQKDEIGQLGDAFNQMADAIQEREADFVELASWLEKTIAERTSELIQQNERLEQLAISDPLTQVYNRRFFFELAEKEFERAKRYEHPLAVVILDADHFKNINDTYGHLIGDQILLNLAQICLENIRSVDIFARYGGEEFVVLMPEADCKAAVTTSERLREKVIKATLLDGSIDIMVSISLGTACWDGKQDISLDTLLARADQALYRAKETGRNQVVLWGDF